MRSTSLPFALALCTVAGVVHAQGFETRVEVNRSETAVGTGDLTSLDLGDLSARIGSRGGQIGVYGGLAAAWSEQPTARASLVQGVPTLTVEYWPLPQLTLQGDVGYAVLLGSSEQALTTLGQGPQMSMRVDYLITATPELAFDLDLSSHLAESTLLPLGFSYSDTPSVTTTLAFGVAWN
jgi:hypothetical protein